VLIRLDDDAEHLRSLQALLINQLLANVEQLRERVLHNLVKLLPLLAGLESVHTTDGQQTLETGVDVVRIIGSEQLKGDIQEAGPLFGEVVLQDLLEEGDQLGADIGRRRRQGRNESFAETRLLSLGNGDTRRTIVDRGPSTADAVLQVNTG